MDNLEAFDTQRVLVAAREVPQYDDRGRLHVTMPLAGEFTITPNGEHGLFDVAFVPCPAVAPAQARGGSSRPAGGEGGRTTP